MTEPVGQQVNPNVQPRGGPGVQQAPQGDQNNDEARRGAERLQQELNDRTTLLGDRIRGTQYNIDRGERDLPGRFNIFAGGVRRGMQQAIEADRRYLDRLQQEQRTQNELRDRISNLTQQGRYEEATAIMQGREQEYRQRIVQAGRQAIRETQAANQTLAEADRRLANVETGLRVAQRVTVIAGAVVATAATGGAGAPLLVTALAGTAAGTGIGALTNFTEAAGHVAHGNMSAGDAFSRAAAQTGQDALTSAQIGISGGVGAAAGRAVIGTAGAQVAPTLTRVVASGMVGGGTGSLTGSVLQTGTNVALGNEQRSIGQIARDTVIQTGLGTISGGLGARGQAALNNTIAQGGTNSLARRLLIRGTTEVAAPTALTLGSHYAIHREINLEQATQDVAMNILSSMVGARINQNQLSGRYGNNWRQNVGHELSMPTFAVAPGAIRRLFARRTTTTQPQPQPAPVQAPTPPPLTQGNRNQPTQNTQPQTQRTVGPREYVALRALEEFQVRAGRGSEQGPNNPNVQHSREVQRLIDAGDHIGAIRYARQNGITPSDLRNYGSNYTRRETLLRMNQRESESLIDAEYDAARRPPIPYPADYDIEQLMNLTNSPNGPVVSRQVDGITITDLPTGPIVSRRGDDGWIHHFRPRDNTNMPVGGERYSLNVNLSPEFITELNQFVLRQGGDFKYSRSSNTRYDAVTYYLGTPLSPQARIELARIANRHIRGNGEGLTGEVIRDPAGNEIRGIRRETTPTHQELTSLVNLAQEFNPSLGRAIRNYFDPYGSTELHASSGMATAVRNILKSLDIPQPAPVQAPTPPPLTQGNRNQPTLGGDSRTSG